MRNITPIAASLLLLGLFGCHQDESEEVVRAKEELSHRKQSFTDQASLLYAQQELALTDANSAAARAAGELVDETAARAANIHVHQAKLRLKLDKDGQQLDEDVREWDAFVLTLKSLQSGGGHS